MRTPYQIARSPHGCCHGVGLTLLGKDSRKTVCGRPVGPAWHRDEATGPDEISCETCRASAWRAQWAPLEESGPNHPVCQLRLPALHTATDRDERPSGVDRGPSPSPRRVAGVKGNGSVDSSRAAGPHY